MVQIYKAIVGNDKVSQTLKMLYHEAIYGSNKDVKSRIHNRVANFRRSLKYVIFHTCYTVNLLELFLKFCAYFFISLFLFQFPEVIQK